jgi:hypothetical protein
MRQSERGREEQKRGSEANGGRQNRRVSAAASAGSGEKNVQPSDIFEWGKRERL